ncbi:MAG: hypothetical protein V4519_05010 [Patescibacteria group bacterium]
MNRRYSLQKDEKQAIRASLLEFMEQHPVQEKSSRLNKKRTLVNTSFFVIATVFSIVIFGGAIVYTAFSGPGDMLYPLKSNMASIFEALQ